MVVFATPGMLHAGLSLQIFKKWAEDEKNMVRTVMEEKEQVVMLHWDHNATQAGVVVVYCCCCSTHLQ